MMEDLPPFSHTLTEQLAQLHRNSIDDHITAVARDVATIAAGIAVQNERGLNMAERVTKIEEALAGIGKEVAEVKDITNRYKGGIAVILGASAFLIAVFTLWDKIVAKLTH